MIAVFIINNTLSLDAANSVIEALDTFISIVKKRDWIEKARQCQIPEEHIDDAQFFAIIWLYLKYNCWAFDLILLLWM